MAENKAETFNPVAEASSEPSGPRLTWDTSNMSSIFANAVNVSGTREEVSLFFGVNQSWNTDASQAIAIDVTNRVILNPFAAKRLSLLLNGVLQEYEKRFGALNLE